MMLRTPRGFSLPPANSSRYPDGSMAQWCLRRMALDVAHTRNDERGAPRAAIANPDWRHVMKFIVQWNGQPTAENAVIERFMKTGGRTPEGVTLLGRWHAVGGLHGVAIVEANDTQSMTAMSLEWGDLLTMNIFPALTDEDLGAALGKFAAGRQ
jgi:hypothetical protein